MRELGRDMKTCSGLTIKIVVALFLTALFFPHSLLIWVGYVLYRAWRDAMYQRRTGRNPWRRRQ